MFNRLQTQFFKSLKHLIVMKKSIFLSLFLLLVWSSLASAQEKMLTIDEIYGTDPKARVNFNGRPTFGVQWLVDGTSYSQTQPGEGGRMARKNEQNWFSFDSGLRSPGNFNYFARIARNGLSNFGFISPIRPDFRRIA